MERKFKRNLKHIIVSHTQRDFSERHWELVHPNLLSHLPHNTRKGVFDDRRISWDNVAMALRQRPLACRGALHKAVLIAHGALNNGPIDLYLTGLGPKPMKWIDTIGRWLKSPGRGIHSTIWGSSIENHYVNFIDRVTLVDIY